MRLSTATPAFAALTLALATTAPTLRADEIRLKDGSVIKGKILGLADGDFSVQSDSLKGSDKTPVKIPQTSVSTFSTDGDFIIATSGQTEAHGKVESVPEGIKISTPDGLVMSKVDNLKDGWIPGADSPADKARKKLERRWEYTVDISIIGKTGNGESIGESSGFTALNKGPDDELKFYAKHNYAKAKGPLGWSKTADDLHAGLEYTSYFSRPVFWYVRSDNGFDRVRQIRFFTTDAFGLGDQLINTEKQKLEVRGGLSYRYESYRSSLPETSAPGLDFGVHHDCQFEYFKMVNDLTYTPTFDDPTHDYLLIHESYVETPLANTESWKLRLGLRNEYRNKVAPGVVRLDTTYYIKFVLNWK